MAAQLQQQFDTHLRSSNAVLQDILISSVKAIIKEEIQLAMRDQQQVLPNRLLNHMRQSGTLTPVNLTSHSNSATPHHHLGGHVSQAAQPPPSQPQDPKSQISNFVSKGQFNSAFQVALCASDLTLLTNLCELITPSQVFEQTTNNASKRPQCQLQQPVILSLIQQLSQDLNSNTELKIKYLEEAVVNLDLLNPLTREHTPSVVHQLIAKIQHFIHMHPHDKNNRQMKMLLMASQSLVRSNTANQANSVVGTN